MQKLDHRCCPADAFHTPLVLSEPIALSAAAGGATLAAAEIAGPAPRTAVDTAVELEQKLNGLQSEIHQLRGNLNLANRTIEDQRGAMDGAATELDNARREFERLGQEMQAWREQLSRLDAEFHRDQAQFQVLMDEMGQRLERMLAECSGGPEMATDTLPDAEEPAATGPKP